MSRTTVIVEDIFANNFVVDFCDELLEGEFDVGIILGRSFNEIESVLLAEGRSAVLRDLTQMFQIRLVSYQHDGDVRVGVLT